MNLTNKNIPLLRNNSSAMLRMQSSIDTTNVNQIDEYDNSYVISDNKSFTKPLSLLNYRNEGINVYNEESLKMKSEKLKVLINNQMINGMKKDNLLQQLKILQELKTITNEKMNLLSMGNQYYYYIQLLTLLLFIINNSLLLHKDNELGKLQ